MSHVGEPLGGEAARAKKSIISGPGSKGSTLLTGEETSHVMASSKAWVAAHVYMAVYPTCTMLKLSEHPFVAVAKPLHVLLASFPVGLTKPFTDVSTYSTLFRTASPVELFPPTNSDRGAATTTHLMHPSTNTKLPHR